MSDTLIPTKTAGARPPILPPVTTTFDGAPEDDSWLNYLQDDVRMICRHADAAKSDGLEMMISLLDRRKGLVVSEIWAYLALQDYPVPLLLDLPVDYLIGSSTRAERILSGLVTQIEECRARCERRLTRQRFEMRLLRDLDASDS